MTVGAVQAEDKGCTLMMTDSASDEHVGRGDLAPWLPLKAATGPQLFDVQGNRIEFEGARRVCASVSWTRTDTSTPEAP